MSQCFIVVTLSCFENMLYLSNFTIFDITLEYKKLIKNKNFQVSYIIYLNVPFIVG